MILPSCTLSTNLPLFMKCFDRWPSILLTETDWYFSHNSKHKTNKMIRSNIIVITLDQTAGLLSVRSAPAWYWQLPPPVPSPTLFTPIWNLMWLSLHWLSDALKSRDIMDHHQVVPALLVEDHARCKSRTDSEDEDLLYRHSSRVKFTDLTLLWFIALCLFLKGLHYTRKFHCYCLLQVRI